MDKVDYIDFQDRNEHLAYLITFRCYGTWLHGDERGSIDRRTYNRYGPPDMPANKKLIADESPHLRQLPSPWMAPKEMLSRWQFERCASIADTHFTQ